MSKHRVANFVSDNCFDHQVSEHEREAHPFWAGRAAGNNRKQKDIEIQRLDRQETESIRTAFAPITPLRRITNIGQKFFTCQQIRRKSPKMSECIDMENDDCLILVSVYSPAWQIVNVIFASV